MQELGPLILGATGRLGQSFQALWSAGLWPDTAAPVWHYRQGTPPAGKSLRWDMEWPLPAGTHSPRARGVIVLAGVTSGTTAELARNTDLALAALDLARAHGLGPVLICSTAAVYGRASGAQDETAPCHPANPYGEAKRAMEAAVADHAAICLRLANVAGCDQLFGAAMRGRVTLDQFSDGSAPERAYIGPLTLARTMLALIDRAAAGGTVPRTLNVAAPHPVRMDALLLAAGIAFDRTPAPPTALASVRLNTARLAAIVPLADATADPAQLVTEARKGGWRPA